MAGALLAGCVFFGLSVVADAHTSAEGPFDCPDHPAEYVGTDDVVNELRALRVDVHTDCLAQLEMVGKVRDSLGDTLTVEGAVDVASPLLDSIDLHAAAIEANTEPGEEAPADMQPVVDAVDAGQLELDAALWFLAGLICALFAGSVFAREALSA